MSAQKAIDYLTRLLDRLSKKEQAIDKIQRRVPTWQNAQRLRRIRRKIKKTATCLEALRALTRANERKESILGAWKRGAYKSIEEMVAALEAHEIPKTTVRRFYR